MLLLALVFGLITGCFLYIPGVWLPDLTGHVTELCSAQSQAGERFVITQFWGDDFYTTRFDHSGPTGASHTQVIEGDARKQWSCSMQLIEPEQKLIVDLRDGGQLIEYLWAENRFIMPPGRSRLRD